MAITIDVIGKYDGKDIARAKKDLKALEDAVKSSSKGIGDKLSGLADGMVDVGETLTKKVTLPIVAAGTAMFAAFTKQEDAEAKFRAALRATGGQANVTEQSIQGLAKRLQETTKFGDETTISAAALLLTFRNVKNEFGEGNDIFDQTIVLAQDMAEFLGQDLQSTVMNLGIAMNDPIAGMGRLRRAGVQLTDEQQNLVRQMVESGDVMGAQKVILEELENQFGGTAEEMAKTSSGKIRQAFNNLGDAAEGFGEIIAESVDKVSEFLSDLGKRLQELSPETRRMIVNAAAFAAAVGPVVLILGKFLGMVIGLTKNLKILGVVLLKNPIVLLIAAIVGLAVWIGITLWRMEGFRETVIDVWNKIRDKVSEVWETKLKPIFERIREAFEDKIVPALQDMWARFQEVWPDLRDAIKEAWTVIEPILEDFLDILLKIGGVVVIAGIGQLALAFELLGLSIQFSVRFLAIPALKQFEFVMGVTRRVIGFLKDTAQAQFEAIGRFVRFVWDRFLSPVFNWIRERITNNVIPAFFNFAMGVRNTFNTVREVVSTIVGIVAGRLDWLGGVVSRLRDRFQSAFDGIRNIVSGIGGFLKSAIEGAINGVRTAWNSTIGGKGFSLPGVGPFPGVNVRVPELASGGIVPGHRGQAVPAILHGGEMVLRNTQVAGFSTVGASTGGGDTYNITINGMVGRDKRDVLEFLAKELPKVAVKAGRSQG